MAECSFNPRRLTLARQRNGYTKQQFAMLSGVSRRTVAAWETGEVDNPPVDLIAKILNFPSSFFIADDPHVIPQDAVSFRALSAMTAREIDRVLAASSLAVELSDWMDKNYKTPPPDLPDLSDTPSLLPALAAESVRHLLAIHQHPIKHLLTLVEKQGVRVFSLPLDNRHVDAFSFWRGNRPFVFLNTAKSAERVRFDLAHELGHLLLHRGVSTQRSRVYEQEAHVFSANLLMPADALYAQIIGRVRLDDVFHLKRFWRVSAVAMVHRLAELAIITEWHYRNWMIELSQRGYRRSEPGGIHPETSILLKQFFLRLREDGRSSRRVAKDLNLPETELNNLVFGLAIAPAPVTLLRESGPQSLYSSV